ncbi:MAG TPA: hypothetical protein VFT99_06600 [Roseiflexaceae bacterium]|nr:hypothetical protein [Roseiflexaceae bacterium]
MVTHSARLEQGDVLIEDIVFDSGEQGPTEAFLVRPAARGEEPYAGILFVHWYEPHAQNSNRTQFLDEAIELARHGTVCLLVSTMWSDVEWFGKRKSADDYQATVRQTEALRRAVDVLIAQPGVDPERIAYVGHDFGAMFGATLAATERRIHAYVLIGGAARYTDWYLFGAADGLPSGGALEAYRAALAPLDPVEALRQASGHFLLQFGDFDPYTPRENYMAFYRATPSPVQYIVYPTDHALDAPIVREDRMAWLETQLGFAERATAR